MGRWLGCRGISHERVIRGSVIGGLRHGRHHRRQGRRRRLRRRRVYELNCTGREAQRPRTLACFGHLETEIC